MNRAILTVALVLSFCTQGGRPATGLTDAQLKSAQMEVPQLVQLLDLCCSGNHSEEPRCI
jgi:hypothetical protein